MSFALNDDQRRVQDLVRRVARERVASRAAAIDASGEYPQDMYDLLRKLGLFTLPFPAEYGGSGSMLSACVAIEELGRVCYNTTYLLIVQWTPFGAVMAGGTEEQKRRYLPGLANGDLRAAFSITEPQSGSDVAGIQTRASRCEGGYRINGGKIWCTNASLADFVVVAAKTGDQDRTGSINFFIVERGTPGFVVGRKEEKMGARGVPSHAIFFEDVFVPEKPASRSGGPGFQDRHGGPERLAPADRRPRGGTRPGRHGPCGDLREEPQGIRPKRCRLSGRALDARRHGDPDRSRPRPGLPRRGSCGRRRHRQGARHHRRDRQMLRHRCRHASGDGRGAALRRRWDIQRLSRSIGTSATPRCCRLSRAPIRSSATSSRAI